jgi:hypothetical protein
MKKETWLIVIMVVFVIAIVYTWMKSKGYLDNKTTI